MSEIAMQLFYEEPSNFIFLNLLRLNMLHEIVEQNISEEVILEKLVLLFAHLFVTEPANPQKTPTLPELPEPFVQKIREFHDRLLQIYIQYLRVFANNCPPADTSLILSKVKFPQQQTLNSSRNQIQILNDLNERALPLNFISPFAGLSGS